jgi:hypothetical protein
MANGDPSGASKRSGTQPIEVASSGDVPERLTRRIGD